MDTRVDGPGPNQAGSASSSPDLWDMNRAVHQDVPMVAWAWHVTARYEIQMYSPYFIVVW